MKVEKGDYVELLNQIEIIANRKFTDNQISNLLVEFSTINWNESYNIAYNIESMHNIPNNIYGFITIQIDNVKKRIKEEILNKEYWRVKDKDRTTKEEWNLISEVFSLIASFKQSKEIFTKYSEKMEDAINKNDLVSFLKESILFYKKKIKNHPELIRINKVIE